MTVLPEEKDAIVTESGRSFKKLALIVLLSVLFAGTIYLIIYRFKPQNINFKKTDTVFLESLKKDASGITFTGFRWNERFFDNLARTATAEAKPEQFKRLFEDFDFLRSSYAATHEPKARNVALQLADYLKAKYPQEVKDYKLDVPCLDSSCTTITYPEEIRNISKLLDEIKFPEDSAYKDFILRSFDAAVLSTDKNAQFSDYYSAFQYLWIAHSKNKDAKAKQAGEALLKFLEAGYQEDVKLVKRTTSAERFQF